jgi:GR25 family glycosyltransferase involved in LPS biosynthesis
LIDKVYIDKNLKYGPGTLGTAMSHVRLWETAVAQDRSITVFEDDAVVSLHFERQASEVLSSLPTDWDLIKWGYNLHPSYAWVDLVVSKFRLHCYGERDVHEFQRRQFRVTAVRMLHAFGNVAYSISARGARAALDYCLPLRPRLIKFPEAAVSVENTTNDVTLCGLYPAIKAFLCVPQLVVQSYEGSVRTEADAHGTTGA